MIIFYWHFYVLFFLSLLAVLTCIYVLLYVFQAFCTVSLTYYNFFSTYYMQFFNFVLLYFFSVFYQSFFFILCVLLLFLGFHLRLQMICCLSFLFYLCSEVFYCLSPFFFFKTRLLFASLFTFVMCLCLLEVYDTKVEPFSSLFLTFASLLLSSFLSFFILS